jgi:hypothetical protein
VSRNHPKRDVRSGPLPALLLLWPNINIDLPDWLDIPDLREIIRDGIDWLLENIAEGVLESVGTLLSVGYERFLFYPNPSTIPVLDTLWRISFGIFFVVVGISFLYMLLMAQLFPGTDKADLQYFLERVAKYSVLVFVSREAISFFATLTNTVAGVYYQSGLDLTVGVTMAQNALGEFGIAGSLLFMMLSVVSLMFAAVGFIIILVLRMLIVYICYALLPLLMAFKLVEIGPWDTVNDLGDKFIKASAQMMLFGILISALLWSGTLVLDYGSYDSGDGAFASSGPTPDTTPDGEFSSHDNTIRDFFMFLTPLLMINFIGFKIIMGIL